MEDPSDTTSSKPSSILGLGSAPAAGGLFSSPYLDFDPKIINPGANESQWIFPDGSINKPTRGRFEMAFSQIGGSVMTGGALGGLMGGINGLRSTRSLENASTAIIRSQLLNYVTKNGANTANTFGVIAVVYSIIGVGLSFVNESQDDLNSLISGTSTGLLYGALSEPKTKSTATAASQKLSPLQTRLKRSVVGGLIGLCLSGSYVLLMNRDKFKR